MQYMAGHYVLLGSFLFPNVFLGNHRHNLRVRDHTNFSTANGPLLSLKMVNFGLQRANTSCMHALLCLLNYFHHLA